ncbi:MAG: GNAT family N-acetyltransferase [Fusobacteriales bacterium]|jgi:phosphinothricin acetyltransferase|nr:GNAT family N-acetyltransferase [Fusobacteriales bacterium]
MIKEMIRGVEIRDAADIAAIYNYYVRETIITFETEEIDTAEMENRIKKILEAEYPFIVHEENNKITGYAYVGKFRERSAYSESLETSIYLDINEKGRGIGRKLYKRLIGLSEEVGAHVLIGVVSYPNLASQRLHESVGFEKAGVIKEAGKKFGKYIDVEFWSYILDKDK